MALIEVAGFHISHVRCFWAAPMGNRRVQHLKSVQRFQTFQEIIDTVQRFRGQGPIPENSVLFVQQAHLPPDLTYQLQDIEGFKEFCQVLAFTSPLHELTKGGDLPSSLEDYDDAKFNYCSGFPITKPVAKINLVRSTSFGEEELRNFLGDHFNYRGRMMFLNLRDRLGEHFAPADYRRIVRNLLGYLIPSS